MTEKTEIFSARSIVTLSRSDPAAHSGPNRVDRRVQGRSMAVW